MTTMKMQFEILWMFVSVIMGALLPLLQSFHPYLFSSLFILLLLI